MVVFVCMFFWMFGGVAHAATDIFELQALVGSDSTPPSTPTSLAVIPVAVSQINLSWASSTDNYLLSGYHVWRDDVHIATTTIAFYADTGLSASTTYTYYVTAFDASNNFSASSTAVATTTFSPVTPVATTTSGGHTYGSLMRKLTDEIITLQVFPQKNSVTIRYTTEGYVRSVVRCGETSSYELNSLAENIFQTRHETTITGLKPGTTYNFNIEGENKIGRYGVMHTGTFVTLPPDDVFPPDNVRNLSAIKDGNDVLLSWVNPEDPDFTKVRVVRNDTFYPSDIADGWVTYEGLNSSIRDTKESDADTQYYTVFTYDTLGNISSGAVVSVFMGDENAIPPSEPIDPTINPIALSFKHLEFIQEEKKLLIDDNNRVYIDGAKRLTVSIPYEKLPEHLKTILITLTDSRNSNREFTFLLRVNAEKTAYTAVLAPFGAEGDFGIQLGVFDFQTSQIGYAKGVLVSEIKPIHTDSETVQSVGLFSSFISSIGGPYVVWLITLILLLIFVGRRIQRIHF